MNADDLIERIQADMTAAMKSKDAATLSTLRMLKSALMEAKTKKPKEAGLTAEEQVEIVRRYAKKRREAIEEFRRVGREDLVAGEEREIGVAARYLPTGLEEDELRARIRQVVEETGAAGPKDAGKVIGRVLAEARGRADGGTVSRLVREILAG